MKLNSAEDRQAPPPTGAPIVFEAIVKQHALAATYNRGSVTLAPHIVYTRHGELYVDAATLERDGKPPRESKIGAFKLLRARRAQDHAAPFRGEPVVRSARAALRGRDAARGGAALIAA